MVQGLLLVISGFVVIVNLVVNTTAKCPATAPTMDERMSTAADRPGGPGTGRGLCCVFAGSPSSGVLAAILLLAAIFGSTLAPQNPLQHQHQRAVPGTELARTCSGRTISAATCSAG